MRGRRPPWVYAIGATLVLGGAVVVGVGLSEPELIPVELASAEVTIAGEVAVEPGVPVAGSTATVRARLTADRPVTLGEMTVKVRDAAGTFHEFPTQSGIRLGEAERTLDLPGVFPKPGDYTYYLAYRHDGDWVELPPWKHVIAR